MRDGRRPRDPEDWLWLVVGVAVAARAALLWTWEPALASDAADYVRIATDLNQGEGFRDTNGDPTSFRGPVYPLFVASILKLTGGSLWAVRVLQVLLDAVTVVVTFRLARATFGERLGSAVGLTAAALVAINLGHIGASQRILSETVFTLVFVAAIAASSMWWRSERPGSARQWAVVAGCVFGIATLTRGVLLLYPAVLVGAACMVRRRVPYGSVALILGFCLTLAPWTIRNYVVHDAFVPVSTQVGVTLYASYNPPGGRFGFQPADSVVVRAERLPEPEASAILVRAAIDTALANPARTARLEAIKVAYFWSPIDWELLPWYGVLNGTYLWMVLVCGVGLFLAPVRKAARRHWPVLLPLVYLFGMGLVFHGSPRYRLPAEPLLAIVAAASVIALTGRWGRGRAGLLLGTLALAVLAAAVYADVLRAIVRPWVSGS